MQYQKELIGVLRWAIELVRVEILLEVSLMSSYSDCPRIGKLEQLFRICTYTKGKPKKRIAFEPDNPHVDKERFQNHDWFDFYRDVK